MFLLRKEEKGSTFMKVADFRETIRGRQAEDGTISKNSGTWTVERANGVKGNSETYFFPNGSLELVTKLLHQGESWAGYNIYLLKALTFSPVRPALSIRLPTFTCRLWFGYSQRAQSGNSGMQLSNFLLSSSLKRAAVTISDIVIFRKIS